MENVHLDIKSVYSGSFYYHSRKHSLTLNSLGTEKSVQNQ